MLKNNINHSCSELLLERIVSEKAVRLENCNVLTFKVQVKSSKPAIKKAVEQLFSVKVGSVKLLRTTGKLKQVRRRVYRQADFKKAYVALLPNQVFPFEKNHTETAEGGQ